MPGVNSLAQGMNERQHWRYEVWVLIPWFFKSENYLFLSLKYFKESKNFGNEMECYSFSVSLPIVNFNLKSADLWIV